MTELYSSPLFGIVLCIFAYEAGIYLQHKTKSPLANPLLIASILIIVLLKFLHIPLESFQRGGSLITLFLAPATAALALSIYNKLDVLKENWLPVLAGTAAGSAVSMSSAYFLSRLFGLNSQLTYSLLPKSVTTPIAMELSVQLGGIAPITVAAVIFTGILGAVFSPLLIKLFRVNDPVTAGLAIGTSSHAIGTSKAVEMGETEGAMSGIAIGIAGLITVVYSLFF